APPRRLALARPEEHAPAPPRAREPAERSAAAEGCAARRPPAGWSAPGRPAAAGGSAVAPRAPPPPARPRPAGPGPRGPPPSRRGRLRRALALALGGLATVAVGLAVALVLAGRQVGPGAGAPVAIDVPPRATASDLARLLADGGAARSETVAAIYLRAFGDA